MKHNSSRELQLIAVLLFIRDSYMRWSLRLVSLKTVYGIFHFRFCFIFIKYVFLFKKKHGLFDFKTS